jgi:predicted house-cleaning noncanonical NTP pyrophosphatase (MazG superfamily)
LETDLPGGQYEMAEKLTEKLIEKVREFLYDTGHPGYKNLVKKS